MDDHAAAFRCPLLFHTHLATSTTTACCIRKRGREKHRIITTNDDANDLLRIKHNRYCCYRKEFFVVKTHVIGCGIFQKNAIVRLLSECCGDCVKVFMVFASIFRWLLCEDENKLIAFRYCRTLNKNGHCHNYRLDCRTLINRSLRGRGVASVVCRLHTHAHTRNVCFIPPENTITTYDDHNTRHIIVQLSTKSAPQNSSAVPQQSLN